MSLIIGITGGIGSGKSAVTERFEQLGITVVDNLDSKLLARDSVSEIQLIRFIDEVLSCDGRISSGVIVDPGVPGATTEPLNLERDRSLTLKRDDLIGHQGEAAGTWWRSVRSKYPRRNAMVIWSVVVGGRESCIRRVTNNLCQVELGRQRD